MRQEQHMSFTSISSVSNVTKIQCCGAMGRQLDKQNNCSAVVFSVVITGSTNGLEKVKEGTLIRFADDTMLGDLLIFLCTGLPFRRPRQARATSCNEKIPMKTPAPGKEELNNNIGWGWLGSSSA